jgi:bifunctional N-acetylglucosamine-1-phosphate-uridyltransferase/glucosamine-1-phosphate-acetyltransferase GlmU-like protein
MADITALILAAGRGTRMKSPLPKVLVPVAGRAIAQRLADNLREAGVSRLCFVVGHRADEVQAALGPRYDYVLQEQQLGMAHAVEMARASLEGRAEHVLVTVGDSPLLQPETIRGLIRRHLDTGAACTFFTATYEPPPPYARVIRDERGDVLYCIEERDCDEGQRAVRELLTSHYVFRADALWAHLASVPVHPVTGERYLTDITRSFQRHGLTMQAVPVEDSAELTGLNSLEDVAMAERWLEARGV